MSTSLRSDVGDDHALRQVGGVGHQRRDAEGGDAEAGQQHGDAPQ